jgi:hypothetical protein
MRFRIPRPSPALAVAVVALIVAATGGALAQTGGGGVIQGCVSRTGAVELITAENTACEPTQEAIAWNQQGPKGDKGDRGEPGDRLSPEATVIRQQAENTLAKAKLGKPKVSKKQAQEVASLDPAPGEAYQFLKSAQVQVKDWFKTEEYTYLGRLVLPRGRFGVTLTARASATAGAPDYPSTYQGRARCVVGAPGSSDSAEGQGVLAVQRALTLQKSVNSVTLHCTGWAAALSNVRLVAIRLRKITTTGS